MHSSTIPLATMLAVKAWFYDTANMDLLAFNNKPTGIYWNSSPELNTDLAEKLPQPPDQTSHDLSGTIPEAKTALVILIQGGGTYSIEVRGDTWAWDQDSLNKCTLEPKKAYHKVICTEDFENSIQRFGLHSISNGQLRIRMEDTTSSALSVVLIPSTMSPGLDNDERWRTIRNSEFYLKTIFQQQKEHIDKLNNLKKKTEDMFTLKPSWMKWHEQFGKKYRKKTTIRDKEAIIISGTDINEKNNKELTLTLPERKPYLIETDIFDDNHPQYFGTLPDGLTVITFSRKGAGKKTKPTSSQSSNKGKRTSPTHRTTSGGKRATTSFPITNKEQLKTPRVLQRFSKLKKQQLNTERIRQRNLRERKRQAKLRDAINVLKNHVFDDTNQELKISIGEPKNLSTIQTLKMAIARIAKLMDILKTADESASANLPDETEHSISLSNRMPIPPDTEMELVFFLQYFGLSKEDYDPNPELAILQIILKLNEIIGMDTIKEVELLYDNVTYDDEAILGDHRYRKNFLDNLSSDETKSFLQLDRSTSPQETRALFFALHQKAINIFHKITESSEPDAE